jgi:hypothetical protein
VPIEEEEEDRPLSVISLLYTLYKKIFVVAKM